MQTILVTGSNGLLGQKLTSLLKDNPEYQLVATSKGPDRYPGKGGYLYREMDIRDENQVQEVIATHRPDVIIHTAAMTNVDACEKDREGCRRLNVDATRYLVNAAGKQNAFFIHLSTDFIFNGESGPYREEDHPDPLSYYGNTKLESETIVRESSAEWAILRTIIVYGVVQDMSRSNIVLWAKGALEKGQPINVVNDQFRMPTLAEDLAEACVLTAKKRARGIFHVSGEDYMSILELVQRVARFFNLDESVITPIPAATLNQAAKRPPKTGFILDKARRELNYHPHSFEEGLEIVKKQLSSTP
ncbi:dTDP-4-dehydrorhamnose reductase [Anseongella ginsenosidimutans]|uniref:dTDP-4-dehydrorhamnose reductase n=1 Tax=Anseongella ginsenosidimutans TaxID=496056 RepID=A0A4R3KLY1_9SPHI|nr:SDR family oxidoreductase [Anseongella ginsenosidimutans]QEC53829.1 SDR family oxidoreductase [Anseongella ginsenosidimutans]TCS83894.1 dTDP-4-dehydrorhamnose reductase [Anseongella ginsenosidimutans]